MFLSTTGQERNGTSAGSDVPDRQMIFFLFSFFFFSFRFFIFHLDYLILFLFLTVVDRAGEWPLRLGDSRSNLIWGKLGLIMEDDGSVSYRFRILGDQPSLYSPG